MSYNIRTNVLYKFLKEFSKNSTNVHFFMQGKNESLRARAILRSLVPLEDLQGVLSLRFTLNNPAAGEERPKSGKYKHFCRMQESNP